MAADSASARTTYIASMGRSGSTVLASCLGAPDGSIAIGEVHYLWDRGLTGQTLCGCLQAVTECPFWRPILDRLVIDLGVEDIARLGRIGTSGPRFRQMHRLIRDPELLEREHGAYLELRRALHRALTDAGYDTIIDSSKRPDDLLALTRIPEIAGNLSVIHLVRHPSRTAASWANPKPDRSRVEGSLTHIGRTRSLAWWYWWNRGIRSVTAELTTPPIRVNWEDVAADPEPVLRQLLGDERCDAVLDSPREVRVQQSHQIGGNPVRLDDASGRIVLRQDRSPAPVGPVQNLLLGREMARLGYR